MFCLEHFSPNCIIIKKNYHRSITLSRPHAVMAMQVVSVTDCSRNDSGSLPTRDNVCRLFSAMQGHYTATFYDAVTVPTEFIISIVNSVKIVNMPWA